MATARIFVTKSSPSTTFAIEADWVRQNASENYSVLGIWIIANNGPQGSTGSYQNGYGYQNVHANGYVGQHTGDPFLPSGYAQNQRRWTDYYEKRFDHDGEGYGPSVSLGMELGYGGVSDRYDNGRVHQGVIGAPPRIAKPPTAPRDLKVLNVTATSAGVLYDTPADLRGSTITGYTADWFEINGSTNPIIWSDTASGGYTSPANGAGPVLKPGTTYHVYVYARSTAGNGTAAGIALTTLPSGPPKITVTPAIDGKSASVTLQPPGGVSGVSQYTIRYRRTTDPSWTTVTTTSNKRTISGLVPGASYQYQASATIGDYTSPMSDLVVVQQPAPNTDPGMYYDGSTAARADVTYSWEGTANQSRSRATGRIPKGWRRFSEGNADSGGTGVLQQVTGGIIGDQAALVVFFSDTVTPGFRGGQRASADAVSAVQEGTFYVGSTMVNPTRSQRMAGELTWLRETAPGVFAEVSRTRGAEAVVPPNSVYELIVAGTAPSTATHAVTGWVDVAGTGWSTFKGGDRVMEDAGQITIAEKYPWFSGDSQDTAEYTYTWEGQPNQSISRRTVNTTVTIDPLMDPDCPPPPRPPRLPVVESECIDEVGVWRRYWLLVPASNVPQWASIVPTITLATDAFAERQVRVRYYPNPLDLDPTVIEAQSFVAEQIVSFVPENTVMTLDGIVNKAWAEVDGGEARSANHLLYGSNGEPPSWPVLTCGYAFAISLDVPLDAPVGNLNLDIALTLRA